MWLNLHFTTTTTTHPTLCTVADIDLNTYFIAMTSKPKYIGHNFRETLIFQITSLAPTPTSPQKYDYADLRGRDQKYDYTDLRGGDVLFCLII